MQSASRFCLRFQIVQLPGTMSKHCPLCMLPRPPHKLFCVSPLSLATFSPNHLTRLSPSAAPPPGLVFAVFLLFYCGFFQKNPWEVVNEKTQQPLARAGEHAE